MFSLSVPFHASWGWAGFPRELLAWAEGLVDASPGGVPLPDLGNLTATAILGWYAWHTASRAIPGLVQHFRDEAAAARNEFRLEREAYHESLRQEREQRHADNAAMVEALREIVASQ